MLVTCQRVGQSFLVLLLACWFLLYLHGTFRTVGTFVHPSLSTIGSKAKVSDKVNLLEELSN